jgi:hypothetical protein
VLRAAATSSRRCCASSVSASAISSTVVNRGERPTPVPRLRGAEASPCSQLLLREPGRRPQTEEHRAERRHFLFRRVPHGEPVRAPTGDRGSVSPCCPSIVRVVWGRVRGSERGDCSTLTTGLKRQMVVAESRVLTAQRASDWGMSAPRMVSRGRLLAALDHAVRRRVTVISAPAGSGKTSLLRAWAERPLSRTPCRLRLSAARPAG